MTIFRTVHNKDYTCVNNYICTDKRLSYKAKGIWLYAFSRKDDWTFYLSNIIDQSTEGKDAVSAGLKELEKCGYLRRSRVRDDKGKLGVAEWVFYEKPLLEDTHEPKADFPILDKPILGNPPLVSTDSLTSTNGNASNAPLPSKKNNFKNDEKHQEKFDLMKSSDLAASEEALRFLARTYTLQKIVDALNHLKREIEIGTVFKKSKIAFFRYILSGKVSMITEKASTNKKWAENAIAGMPWPSLKVHEKYVECLETKKEIPFDISQEEFGRQMDELWKLNRKLQVSNE
jgi:hypothetical protein